MKKLFDTIGNLWGRLKNAMPWNRKQETIKTEGERHIAFDSDKNYTTSGGVRVKNRGTSW
jgi:hypothetical protein